MVVKLPYNPHEHKFAASDGLTEFAGQLERH